MSDLDYEAQFKVLLSEVGEASDEDINMGEDNGEDDVE